MLVAGGTGDERYGDKARVLLDDRVQVVEVDTIAARSDDCYGDALLLELSVHGEGGVIVKGVGNDTGVRAEVESGADHVLPAHDSGGKDGGPVVPSGIESLDAVLRGGFPIGAVSEITGPECSGRTSLAHSFVAQVIAGGKVAAWIDVSDTFDPASAAAAGIDLRRLLWVRCGVTNLTITCRHPPIDIGLTPRQTSLGRHNQGMSLVRTSSTTILSAASSSVSCKLERRDLANSVRRDGDRERYRHFGVLRPYRGETWFSYLLAVGNPRPVASRRYRNIELSANFG